MAQKKVKAWGGFTDGKLDWRYEYASGGDVMVFATYRTKKAASGQYQDVRPVEIVIRPARSARREKKK